jgi:hypothetical protein
VSLIPRWKHIHDIDKPGDVYLSRLMLLRTPWFGVYFHIIRRPDWSRCQHDHPWPFVTVILRGGYVEEVGGQTFTRRAGYVGYRPSSFEHTITRLLNGPSYSLVLRGPNRETWGFRTPDGKDPLGAIHEDCRTRSACCGVASPARRCAQAARWR